MERTRHRGTGWTSDEELKLEVLLCKNKSISCPPPLPSSFCASNPLSAATQCSQDQVFCPNEKKLVGKSWTQSYINLHLTEQAEGETGDEEKTPKLGHLFVYMEIYCIRLLARSYGDDYR